MRFRRRRVRRSFGRKRRVSRVRRRRVVRPLRVGYRM